LALEAWRQCHPVESKRDKLQALLAQSSGNLDQGMPLLAALLSIPGCDRYPLPEMTHSVVRTGRWPPFLDQTKGLATKQPILILFEDLHWIDPTSLELLSLAIEQIGDQRILLATARPEFTPTWPSDRPITTVSLNRLGRPQDEALIAGATKAKGTVARHSQCPRNPFHARAVISGLPRPFATACQVARRHVRI
jgi:predicted ATPase